MYPCFTFQNARVVKLADTPDLGSGAVRREGSSPSPSTIYSPQLAGFFADPRLFPGSMPALLVGNVRLDAIYISLLL